MAPAECPHEILSKDCLANRSTPERPRPSRELRLDNSTSTSKDFRRGV